MSRLESQEVNFDGLVGLTHNYGGLSHGNVASTINAGHIANPRAAALQGLQKMKSLADMGVAQGVLPPHERPYLPTLRRLGFIGDDKTVFANAWRQAPQIAQACMSAAAMWVANAATVSPSPDTKDGLTHFTPANLNSMFHRSIEHQTTARVLQAVFADPNRYRQTKEQPITLGFVQTTVLPESSCLFMVAMDSKVTCLNQRDSLHAKLSKPPEPFQICMP